MDNDPTREAATCCHPELNTADLTQAAQAPSAAVPAGGQYATRHISFMYFHSIIDSPYCAKNVVNLSVLVSDLKSIDTTAIFNLITPNLCNDGHDAPCLNGQPSGLTSADASLKKWVPLVMSSPAYQQNGLLIINFDESSYATVTQPSPGVTDFTYLGSACCSQQTGPNLPPFPQTSSLSYKGATINLTTQSFGGNQTGAVMISKFIKPGETCQTSRTTTIRCRRASRTSSGSITSAMRRKRACRASAPTPSQFCEAVAHDWRLHTQGDLAHAAHCCGDRETYLSVGSLTTMLTKSHASVSYSPRQPDKPRLSTCR
ncbi:hypothetical protein [Burkholderia sp. MSMB1078WGS]|uniref:hypothetical protein n=1 Tax=Burkholderia sp. MSMB1078WGS TaxID=1637900 RepID=UPI0027B9C29E|nr:hypothetical protein [Burkholderia sp. MSMB1078WGS]